MSLANYEIQKCSDIIFSAVSDVEPANSGFRPENKKETQTEFYRSINYDDL